MLIVHVHVKVIEEYIDEFRVASLENAKHSIQEPGVLRFDVIQQIDDPQCFVLVEVYRTEVDPAYHKTTAHYAKWRDIVEPMMAEPRRSIKYNAIFPPEDNWGQSITIVPE